MFKSLPIFSTLRIRYANKTSKSCVILEKFDDPLCKVVLFCRTMETYSYDVTPLIGFLVSHRDKYEELLLSRLRVEMNRVWCCGAVSVGLCSNVEQMSRF